MIRLATGRDGAAVAGIYDPFARASPITFETDPPGPAEMQRRIETTLQSHPWLIYEVQGTAAAYAYATSHRARAAYQWCVETSVYVDERFRRRGLGTALYAALFRVLAAQGFVNAYAGITLPNPASVALHESVGFALLGVYRGIGYKLGAWHDVGWWERPLRARDAEPQPPRPLPVLLAERRLDELLEGESTGGR